tara:strand:+ start:6397 stop:6717 length:321 start_codon:yes stop_codon:yes gene_type:complete
MIESDKVVIALPKNKNQINESFLRQFGFAIEMIIKNMFGLNNLNFRVRGPKNSVEKLIQTLEKEQEYAESFRRLGLTNPSVINNKYKLQAAVGEFEKTTGIKWPLK